MRVKYNPGGDGSDLDKEEDKPGHTEKRGCWGRRLDGGASAEMWAGRSERGQLSGGSLALPPRAPHPRKTTRRDPHLFTMSCFEVAFCFVISAKVYKTEDRTLRETAFGFYLVSSKVLLHK